MKEKIAKKWLDESLPVGVLEDEQSELVWEECCASCPDNPFLEWERRKGGISVA
jgi:hypothetical protein